MPLVEVGFAGLEEFLRTRRIAVLLFWGPWSGPDVRQKALLATQPDCDSRLIGFGSINVDGFAHSPFDRLAQELELITLPITDVFREGKRSRRLIGVRSPSDSTRAVSSAIRETLAPSWLSWSSRRVPNLARALRNERRFAELPILADALEDAGCHDELILEHLRTPGPHANRCLVLEALLDEGPQFWLAKRASST